MAKYLIDAAMDAAFSYVVDRASFMWLCSTVVNTYTLASDNNLGSLEISAGDFTQADGAVNGRAMSITAQISIPVSVAGNILHVAIVTSGGASVLLFLTSSTSKAVTIGDAVNVPAFRDTIADAA